METWSFYRGGLKAGLTVFTFLRQKLGPRNVQEKIHNTNMLFQNDNKFLEELYYGNGREIDCLYVLAMSCTHFRVNPHYICLNVMELIA